MCHFVPVDPDCDFHIYGHPYVSVHIYDDERKYYITTYSAVMMTLHSNDTLGNTSFNYTRFN